MSGEKYFTSKSLGYPRSFLGLLVAGFLLVALPLLGTLLYSAWHTERLTEQARSAMLGAAKAARASRSLVNRTGSIERLALQIAPGVPHTVILDGRHLRQVLLNLLGNAIKFTDSGEVRIEVSASDGSLMVAVTDTGPGIGEKDQENIFEEFRQAQSASTQKKGGTGLGLAIVKSIATAHGGQVKVESVEGQGSCFRVELPLA